MKHRQALLSERGLDDLLLLLERPEIQTEEARSLFESAGRAP